MAASRTHTNMLNKREKSDTKQLQNTDQLSKISVAHIDFQSDFPIR